MTVANRRRLHSLFLSAIFFASERIDILSLGESTSTDWSHFWLRRNQFPLCGITSHIERIISILTESVLTLRESIPSLTESAPALTESVPALKESAPTWMESTLEDGDWSWQCGRWFRIYLGGAGRDTDRSVRVEDNRLSYPPGGRRQPSWACLWKHEQTKPHLNRWRNRTTGWRPVDNRLIRGTTAALRCWFLANVPTPNYFYKPSSCKACSGI